MSWTDSLREFLADAAGVRWYKGPAKLAVNYDSTRRLWIHTPDGDQLEVKPDTVIQMELPHGFDIDQDQIVE